MAKRGYKLQEFVAHSGNVNCLCIGKKGCRHFLTGGEDCKVSLWAIGKPNSLMSLSGHTSPVDSVAFDSAETLVLAGASSGVIKLWDLEEAKMVRGLTGHRSSCISVEFHPFGEFFASGSTDTNLKLWDIRKKGCIHTYKGHTRGISTIRFSPDGRWVVSGGLDNVVKVWDLTAGKLLHDFKFHENHIRSITFHPLEFLLATGSADKTVKFWDLETFELIGSTRPEASGVRTIAFHPDGRTLFCGSDESLKVYSWEPVICHDAIDMGWSKLGDLCIHDGKVLGCSYYENSVGVWVADVSVIEPCGTKLAAQQKDSAQNEFDLNGSRSSVTVGSSVRSSAVVRCPSPDYEPREIKNIYVDTAGESPVSSQRIVSINAPKVILPVDPQDTDSLSIKTHASVGASPADQSVPKSNSMLQQDGSERKETSLPKRESITFSRTKPGMLLRPAHRRRPSSTITDYEVLPAETKPNPDAKFSFDAHADVVSVSKPADARRLSKSKLDAEVLVVPIEDTKVSLDNPETRNPAADVRTPLSFNFDHLVLSTPTESKPINNTRNLLDSRAVLKSHKGLATRDTPKELTGEETPSNKNALEKLGKMSPESPNPVKCESRGSEEGITSVKIVNGVAVVPGRTRTLVERFEKRERLSGTEAQTSLETCQETLIGDKPDTSAVEKMERVSLSSTDSKIAISPPHITPPRDEAPSVPLRSLNRRESSKDKNRETANIVTPNIVLGWDKISRHQNETFERRDRLDNKEEEKTITTPHITPPRDEAPSVPVRSLNRRESSKDKTRETANIVTPNIVLGWDKISRHQNETFERRDRLDNREEEKTITTLHAVPRDKTSTALNERREGLDSNDDEKTVLLPCAVPNNTPTALTSSFIREPLQCKEEEKTITPPRPLPRDKTPTAVGVSSERRERFNSKEDQVTRVSSRVISSREKAHIVGGIRRREKLNGNEDQMVNAGTRLTSSRERSRMSTTAERLERSQRFNSNEDQESTMPLHTISAMDRIATSLSEPHISGRDADSANDEDVAEVLMQSHEMFLSTLRSRLTKLQVIHHFFERNDMRGAINAMRKLPDHSVQADVISILMEKMDILNLDLFSCLLPVLMGLLDSKIERHTKLSLEMLLKLVAVFGQVVYSTVSAPAGVGVDLHAEQRRESCKQCFSQLEKIKKILPLLLSRGGVVARCVQELNLMLQQL